MTEIRYLPRINALTRYEIACSDDLTAAEVFAGVNKISTRSSWQNGVTVSGEANRREMQQIEAMVQRIQQNEKNVQKQIEDAIEGREPTQETRVVVAFKKYRVGDMLHGKTIIRLGMQWRAKDDDYSVHGIEPWVDYIQYAYLK